MYLTNSHIRLRKHRYLSSNLGIVQSLFAFGGDFVPLLSVHRLHFLLAVTVKVGVGWCHRCGRELGILKDGATDLL